MIFSCSPPPPPPPQYPEKNKKMTGIHTVNFFSVPFDIKVQIFSASLKKNSEHPIHKPAASLAEGVGVRIKNGIYQLYSNQLI